MHLLVRRLVRTGALAMAVGLLLSLGAAGAHAAPQAVEAPELTREDVNAWLDGMLPSLLEREAIVGATVAVVGDGGVITERGYGAVEDASDGAQVPVVPEESLFRIGSISKLVTATAVMQLVERDLVDLDAPVGEYLDFSLETRFATPVTLRHLLTHTAGFEDKVAGVIGDPTAAAPSLREAVTVDPPEQIFEPGTTPAYSNYSNGLAAYVVEQVVGEPYAKYVQREIFDPAGMSNATLDQPVAASQQENMSHGYAYAGGDEIPFEMNSPAPAGAISATASDMSAFMLALLPGSTALLQPASLDEMQAPALSEEQLGGLAAGPRMAVGFFGGDRNGHRILSHGGDLTAFHAQLDLYPDDRAGIYISLNSTGIRGDGTTAIRDMLSRAFSDRYFPDERDDASAATETAGEHADAIAGAYQVARRSESTFMRLFFALSAVDVVRGGGSTVSISALTDASGAPVDLIEVEPWVWEEVEGQRRVAVDYENGEVRAIGLNPAFALQPMPATSAVLPMLAGVSGAILLLTLLAGPLMWLLRRWYQQPSQATRSESVLSWTRFACLLALACAGVLWGVIASALLSDAPPVSEALIRGAQVLTLVAVLGVVPAVLLAVIRGRRAWNEPSRRGWLRCIAALIVVAGFIGLGYVAVIGGLLAPSISY